MFYFLSLHALVTEILSGVSYRATSVSEVGNSDSQIEKLGWNLMVFSYLTSLKDNTGSETFNFRFKVMYYRGKQEKYRLY